MKRTESLTPLETAAHPKSQAAPRKLFIRTFGCQMNEYDSDKMADVLNDYGPVELTPDPDEADIILFNTCSVREKAQEKVFSDLGRVRHLKEQNPDLIIGVGGCVASQEGQAIVQRAPFVDLVFGPQTLHRLPDMIEQKRSTGRAQVDISFPEIEKEQEKVFSDLGRVRHLKEQNPDLIIGVGGCVASQEGQAIVQRAPFVDLVFGPQTLHRLPDMIEQKRSTGRAQVDISFPEIEKFDNLPPARVDGPTAFVSIMEGCSKYCSFCVVPYTRGPEISRPFEDVLIEIADLADQGVKEVTLLGQNVNAYRGHIEGSTGIADFAMLLEYVHDKIGRAHV